MEIKQIECFDCRGTGKCSRCKGTGLIDCNCRDGTLNRVYMVYERRSGYYSESLGYYICNRCNRLWMVRFQCDAGTGEDDIWMQPGEEGRHYKFDEEVAFQLRVILGATSPGELPESLVFAKPWLRDLARKKLEELL